MLSMSKEHENSFECLIIWSQSNSVDTSLLFITNINKIKTLIIYSILQSEHNSELCMLGAKFRSVKIHAT
ncbi:hypothetical protein X975_14451, partial [Stegodyphus mimosarum]